MASMLEDLLKPDPFFEHILSRGIAEQQAIRQERRNFLADPGNVEKIISHWQHGAIPDKDAGKIPLGSNLDKIEKAIPEGDPRKGLGQTVASQAALAIQANPDKHPAEVVSKLYLSKLDELNKNDALYKYIREQGSSFFGKTPAKAPGYDEWKARQDAAKPDWEMTNPLLSFAIGAGMSLAGAGIGSLLAPGPGTVAGGLAGRAAGTAIGGYLARTLAVKAGTTALGSALRAGTLAIPSFAAFDVPSNLIRRSDWAQDRPVASTVAEIALGLGAAHTSDVVAKKLFTPIAESLKSVEFMKGMLEKDPSVANILEYDAARSGLDKEAWNLLKNKKYVSGQNVLDKMGMSRAEYEAEMFGGPAKTVAAPRMDEAMMFELKGRVAKGEDVTAATEDILKTRVAQTAVERMQKIETDKLAADQNYRFVLDRKLGELKNPTPEDIARATQEARNEYNIAEGMFSPDEIAREMKSGYAEAIPKAERKLNPVTLQHEISKVQAEGEALSKKYSWEEFPPSYEGAPKKELLANLNELEAARISGRIGESEFKMYSGPIEAALRKVSPNLKADMSIFDIRGTKIESPEFIGKLKLELEGAINTNDPERYRAAITHYMTQGSGKSASEVEKVVRDLQSTERYRNMVKSDLEGITKETEKLTQGDIAGTKKSMIKDIKAGMSSEEVSSKYGRLGLWSTVPLVALSGMLLGGNDAEAGIIKPDMIARAAMKALGKTDEQVMKEMADKGLVSARLTGDKLGFVPQKSINFSDVHGRLPSITEDVANRGSFSRFFSTIMTPGAVGQFIFKPFSSAQPIIASKTVAAMNNSYTAKIALKNIFDTYGIKDESKEIAKMFKPFVERYSVPLHELGEYKHQISLYDQILSGKYAPAEGGKMAGLSKRIKGGGRLDEEDLAMIDDLANRRQAIVDKVAEYEPITAEYTKGMEAAYKDAASKYSSSRVFMAVNGMGMSEADPWLKSILSHNEKMAAARIKDMLGQYSDRAVASGMDVITSKDFMHYVAHPDMDWKAIKGAVEKIAPDAEGAIDMARFHRRGFDTLPMMPDVRYAMDRYVPDADMRIEMASFWKEWRPFMAQAKAANYHAVSDYMQSIAKGFSPVTEMGSLDKLANTMQMFEVARLISLSPSVGFKHSMKVMANIALSGFGNAAKNLPKAVPIWKDIVASNLLKEVPANLRGDLAKAHIGAQNLHMTISDMLPAQLQKNIIDKGLDYWNQRTNFIVNNIELADRSFSFASAVAMAAKQGMTPTQASYLIHDTILKANFLSGVHNPSWLRDPKVRLLMLFQGTPYKIFEQRAITAIKGGGAIGDAYKELMRQLRGDLTTGARNFQLGLIKDALMSPKDLNGVSYAKQLMNMILTAGAVVTAGKYLGSADLSSQVFHLPFTKSGAKEHGLELGMNPMMSAAMETMQKAKWKEDDSTNAIIEFFGTWLKDFGVPQNIVKVNRLTKSDIPAIYQDSKIKYIFGTPAWGE